MNIDLKQIIVSFPDAQTDRQKLQGLLRDMYPKEKRDVNVLLSVMDAGIPEELQRVNVLDSVQLHRLTKKIEDECGFSEAVAADALSTWATALGKETVESTPTPQPETPKTPDTPKEPDMPKPPVTSSPVQPPVPNPPPAKKSSKAWLLVAVAVGLFFGVRALNNKPSSTATKPKATTTVSATAKPSATIQPSLQSKSPAKTISVAQYDLARNLRSLQENDAVGTRGEDFVNDNDLKAHLYTDTTQETGITEVYSYCGGILARASRQQTINGKKCKHSVAEYYGDSLYSVTLREFDSQGNVTSYAVYDDQGRLQVYNTYEENITERHAADGTLKLRWVDEFDAAGNKMERTYGADGKLSALRKYDATGRELSCTLYDSNGKVSSIFEYHPDGSETYSSYAEDGTLKYVSESDTHGNQISNRSYKNGAVDYTSEYANEYNAAGQLTTVYDVNNGNKTLSENYEYNSEGKPVRCNTYYSSGKVYCVETWEYDVAGNQVAQYWAYDGELSRAWYYVYTNAGKKIMWQIYKYENSDWQLERYTVYNLDSSYTAYNPDGTVRS